MLQPSPGGGGSAAARQPTGWGDTASDRTATAPIRFLRRRCHPTPELRSDPPPPGEGGCTRSGGMMMLTVDNVSLYYGAAQALRGVSLEARPGEVTCVLGRNGVGKTSLLRAIVGQRPISRGSILFDGREILRPEALSSAPVSASPTCRRAARSFRFSPSRRTSRPAMRRCRAASAASRTRSSSSSRC